LRALSKRNAVPCEASCPFDKNRDGFVLAEGSATLVLEELNHALNRGANIYAEIIGYATNSGAHHMVIPKPTGQDINQVMINALKDAKIYPKDINYINAHGTSTIQNDKVETKAIKEVFSEYAYKIPVSSTKSMIGHTIGAAGAIEALVCALALENQIIPPTINYKTLDPECDLDYVPNKSRQTKLTTVISNSFGFGSNNVCLILKRWPE
jgi:3-oxoacyl-[acyl-carrier-protein] synthase II